MKKLYLSVFAALFAVSLTAQTLENGHEYVDLGDAGKWATCNIGASSPEEFGDYFSFGAVYTQGLYTPDACITHGKQFFQNKQTSGNGVTQYVKGNPQYDVATKQWGGTWRVPTADEIELLLTKCTWTWEILNGVAGFRVTTKSTTAGIKGNSIFLPAAGYKSFDKLLAAGTVGEYWTCTPESNYYNHKMAYYLLFHHKLHKTPQQNLESTKENKYCTLYYRSDGKTIRPICVPQ